MQSTVLIQKSIQRQATARKRLPSPIAQFRVFLNRGAKPSPEDKAGTPPPPEGEAQGEAGGDAPNAPAGEASQDAPEPTQGASEDGEGETLPPAPETPQGETADAPAKGGKAKGARKRGK